jgi:hypothetical protein
MSLLANGNLALGTGNANQIISLGGNQARTIWMERNVTPNTAGNNLTLQAGGATSASTDKAGGTLIFRDGLGTGNSTFTSYQWYTSNATTSGTADQAQTVKMSLSSAGVLTLGSLAGILKGTAGAIGTATSGVDYEVPLTFGNGLTRTVNAIANNLITGLAGSQIVIGGTAASETLTLSSTSNATKGKIIFGNSVYDEVNNRIGIGLTVPTNKLHIDAGTATASNLQFTANATTGQTASDGFKIGIDTSANGIINQQENLPITVSNNGSTTQIFNADNSVTFAKWKPTADSTTALILYKTNGTTVVAALDTTNSMLGLGLTPVSKLHQDAGNATANYHQFTCGTTTGVTATDGTLVGLDTTGQFNINQQEALAISVKTTGTERINIAAGGAVTISNLASAAQSVVSATNTGVLNTIPIVTGKLTDAATITLLTTAGNWTGTVYTGAAITGTYEGMYYCDAGNVYKYECYADNGWIRISRA